MKRVVKLRRSNSRTRPEGPFESDDTLRAPEIKGDEFARFLDFIDALRDEAVQVLSLKHGYDETRLITTLLRNHLQGKMSTTSVLARASGLGYGTAIRAINSIELRGLIARRTKTNTGKSFSLHPTDKLIAEWQEYARRVRGAIGATLGAGAVGKVDPVTIFLVHLTPSREPFLLHHRFSPSSTLRAILPCWFTPTQHLWQ